MIVIQTNQLIYYNLFIYLSFSALPLDKVESNKALAMVVTYRGGHLGFMDGWKPTVPYYGDRLIEQYHKGLLDIGSTKDLLEA